MRKLHEQLPWLLGLLSHQKRKGEKKKKVEQENFKGRQCACSEVVCLLSLAAKTDWKFTVWPKTRITENILGNALREAWEENERECHLTINGWFYVHIVSFISIWAESSAFLKINPEELEIVNDGFKLCFHLLGMLEVVTTVPSIIQRNFTISVDIVHRYLSQLKYDCIM